jgi:DnaJ-class molecular chaperone
MSAMSHDPFAQGAIPDGMRWCPHCNGYGSSLRENAERCTHCAGDGPRRRRGSRAVRPTHRQRSPISCKPRGD